MVTRRILDRRVWLRCGHDKRIGEDQRWAHRQSSCAGVPASGSCSDDRLRVYPIAVAGPSYLFGYAFAIGAGVALMGLAMSVSSVVDGRNASKGARRRGAAIGLGVVGAVLCGGSIITLVALWLWLPGVGAYTPFGSTPGWS